MKIGLIFKFQSSLEVNEHFLSVNEAYCSKKNRFLIDFRNTCCKRSQFLRNFL